MSDVDPRTQAAAEAAWQVENAYRTRYGNNGTGTEWARFVADAEAALAAADAWDAANGYVRVRLDRGLRWKLLIALALADGQNLDGYSPRTAEVMYGRQADAALAVVAAGVPAHPKEDEVPELSDEEVREALLTHPADYCPECNPIPTSDAPPKED